MTKAIVEKSLLMRVYCIQFGIYSAIIHMPPDESILWSEWSDYSQQHVTQTSNYLSITYVTRCAHSVDWPLASGLSFLENCMEQKLETSFPRKIFFYLHQVHASQDR